MGWVHAPVAFLREREPVPIVQNAGWAPGSVCAGAPTGIRCSDRLARRESLTDYTIWANDMTA